MISGRKSAPDDHGVLRAQVVEIVIGVPGRDDYLNSVIRPVGRADFDEKLLVRLIRKLAVSFNRKLVVRGQFKRFKEPHLKLQVESPPEFLRSQEGAPPLRVPCLLKLRQTAAGLRVVPISDQKPQSHKQLRMHRRPDIDAICRLTSGGPPVVANALALSKLKDITREDDGNRWAPAFSLAL